MFTVTVNHEIDDQRIEDLLVGAFEGGSGYWATIEAYVNPENKKVEYPYCQLPLIEDCGVIVSDGEGGEIEKGALLNRETLEKGIEIMSKKYDRHFKNFIEENDDAITADVFLQCCLLGEIVYG